VGMWRCFAVGLVLVVALSAGCLDSGAATPGRVAQSTRIAQKVERIRPGDLPAMRHVRCQISGRIATCTGQATLAGGSYNATQDFIIEADGTVKPSCPAVASDSMPTIFCAGR
jgi:hypothetical protein